MDPRLLHIYGPLYVNSYGLAIAIGLIVFVILCQKNKEFSKIVTPDQFNSLFTIGVISALAGGRIWFAITESSSIDSISDLFKPWMGGFSVLGSIVGILIVIPFFLRAYKIPVLKFLDIIALNTPLLHAISRLGCFYAGCCYGMPTDSWYGVVYSHPACIAPLHMPLHPTQLYSSILLAMLFLALYSIKKYLHEGQIVMLYLVGAGIERFVVDIFRNDRIFLTAWTSYISVNQMLALLFVCVGTVGFFILNKKASYESVHFYKK